MVFQSTWTLSILGVLRRSTFPREHTAVDLRSTSYTFPNQEVFENELLPRTDQVIRYYKSVKLNTKALVNIRLRDFLLFSSIDFSFRPKSLRPWFCTSGDDSGPPLVDGLKSDLGAVTRLV